MRAVNLLPRDDPKRGRGRMTIGMQLALVAPFVIVSLIGAGFLLESSKVNDNRATLKALQDELAALPPPTSAAATNPQLALQHSERVSALGLALQSRVAWDRILREISSVLPEDVWLSSLSASSPDVAATTPPPTASTTTTTTTTTTTPSGGAPTTTTPAPRPSTPSALLALSGYTYSQEGVARFLGRLAVIPELEDVKLQSSTQAIVFGRTVVQFEIQAGVKGQAAA